MRADIKLNKPKPATGYIDGQVITCICESDLHQDILNLVQESKVASIEYVRFFEFPSEMKQISTKVAEPKFVQLSESQAKIIIEYMEKISEQPAREVVSFIANKIE